MPGDDIDPFEISGNLSIISSSNAGDGSIDVDSNINLGGYLGENLAGSGTSVRNLINISLKESNSGTGNAVISEHTLFIDSSDSLLKTKNLTGNTLVYHPTKFKGDLIYHTGIKQERLAIGTENQVLSVSIQGTPVWRNVEEAAVENYTKYFNSFISNGSEITTSFSEVLFNQFTKLDNIYLKNITFLETGTYLVSYRISLDEENNGDVSSTVKLQTNKTGILVDIPRTSSTFFHTDNNNSITSINTFTYNAVKNEKIVCLISKNASQEQVLLIPNACNFSIVKIDNEINTTKYFNRYSNNNLTFSSSYADVPLTNSIAFTESTATYSINSNIITISEQGNYLISYNASNNSTTSTGNVILTFASNGSNVYSEVNSSILLLSQGNSSGNSLFVTANSGDKFKLRNRNGANSVNLNLIKLSSEAKVFYGYNTNSITLPNRFIDNNITTEVVKDNIYSHDTNSHEINILEFGTYFVSCKVNCSGNSNSVTKSVLTESNGNYLLELRGSSTYSTGTHTSSISGIFDFAANTKLVIQSGMINGSSSVISDFNILIVKFGNTPVKSDYSYAESSPLTENLNANYIRKLRLHTGDLDSGEYTISWTYDWSIDSPGRKVLVRLTLDESDTFYIIENESKVGNSITTTSSFINKFILDGAHYIDLEFKSENASNYSRLSNTRLLLTKNYQLVR